MSPIEDLDSEPHQHPFPLAEPEVTVAPRADADLREVLRVDAGSFFVALEVGEETMWSFYDWPERKLTNVTNTRVVGRAKYRGEDCLDIADILFWGKDAGSWTRWLYRVKDEQLSIVLRELRHPDGLAEIWEADVTPEPLRLTLGRRWEGHEIYRCGAEEQGAGERHHGLIDGPFRVGLPVGDHLCLRETHWTLSPGRVGESMAEIYVAESGRSVYFRRFNGPGWHNYDQLTGNPEREHDGVTWRLWYECLPDIALRPG